MEKVCETELAAMELVKGFDRAMPELQRDLRSPEDLTYHSQHARLSEIIDAVAHQAIKPQGNDSRISACMMAILEKIYDPAEVKFRNILIDNLLDPKAKGYGTPDQSAMKLLRAIQSPLLKDRSKSDYPQDEKYLSAYGWHEAIDDILNDDVKNILFVSDLWLRKVQSNISQRYVTPAWFISYLAERNTQLDRPISIMDFGSSLNIGLIKLTSESPFGQVEVGLARDQKGGLIVDKDKTERITELAAKFRLSHGMGVEIEYMDDYGAKWWAKSNSGYPSEWLDPSLEKEFEFVNQMENPDVGRRDILPPNVVNERADFTILDSLKGTEMEEESFDFVTIFTALYGLDAASRRRAVDNALHFAKHGILIQDFVYVSGKNSLHVYKHIFDEDYRYNFYYIDKNDPKREKQLVGTYKNGRCKELVLNLGSNIMQNFDR